LREETTGDETLEWSLRVTEAAAAFGLEPITHIVVGGTAAGRTMVADQ
jgi:hypothetical protein